MRIVDNNNPATTGPGQTAPATQTPAAGPASKSAPKSSVSSSDGLQLSSFAGNLSRVMHSDSASRSERIAQLTTAVQSGTYRVDSMAVSRAIIDQSMSAGHAAS